MTNEKALLAHISATHDKSLAAVELLEAIPALFPLGEEYQQEMWNMIDLAAKLAREVSTALDSNSLPTEAAA